MIMKCIQILALIQSVWLSRAQNSVFLYDKRFFRVSAKDDNFRIKYLGIEPFLNSL